MKLIVRPWWHLTSLGKLDLDVHHAIVSISSPPPFAEPVKIPMRWGQRAILPVCFHDLNMDRILEPGKVFKGRALREWAMQPEHAREIWRFALRWKDEVDAIVVHCEAGVSRSPSVAMALADGLGWGRECIDWSPHSAYEPPPNGYVYRIMRECQPAGS